MQFVTLMSGENVAGIHFGVYRPVEVAGSVWHDLNGDGEIHEEPGVRDVLVFLDSDRDGFLDEGETSTRTGDDGGFSFGPREPGIYPIRISLPAGWILFDGDSPVHDLTVRSGGIENPRKVVGFGIVRAATIAGNVWLDLNGIAAKIIRRSNLHRLHHLR
jgi:hypothetical protein